MEEDYKRKKEKISMLLEVEDHAVLYVKSLGIYNLYLHHRDLFYASTLGIEPPSEEKEQHETLCLRRLTTMPQKAMQISVLNRQGR